MVHRHDQNNSVFILEGTEMAPLGPIVSKIKHPFWKGKGQPGPTGHEAQIGGTGPGVMLVLSII